MVIFGSSHFFFFSFIHFYTWKSHNSITCKKQAQVAVEILLTILCHPAVLSGGLMSKELKHLRCSNRMWNYVESVCNTELAWQKAAAINKKPLIEAPLQSCCGSSSIICPKGMVKGTPAYNQATCHLILK